ncbi:MAG: adenine deaminase C-terminal domain-containing protein [Actinomycetota bacterium]
MSTARQVDIRSLIDAAEGVRKADLVLAGGRLVNVMTGEVYFADVAVAGERIAAIGDVEPHTGPDTEVVDVTGLHLVPGLIDGHIHIECSKLSPTMFADAVVRFGTTSVVSALDQIYVVAGLNGIRDAFEELEQTPLKVFWAAPFKVPYTVPESNVGFRFGPQEHRLVQAWPECFGVWETVSEFVLNRDPDILDALEQARANRLPVFGCAPMARGTTLSALVAAGIRLDHESYSPEEALEKLRNGMFVIIRESSVAHFFEENIKLITEMGVEPSRIAFCTDDVTATDILANGHLDRLVRMAVGAGVEPVTAIQMATINCAQMYRIDHLVGSLSPGRYADVVLVDDPASFQVQGVVSKGRFAVRNGDLRDRAAAPVRSRSFTDGFKLDRVPPADLRLVVAANEARVRVLAMEMDPRVPFIRRRRDIELSVANGIVQPDPEKDAIFVTVVERYGLTNNRPVAVVSGFGLRSGALATSAAPDDNNIVCVGATPDDMAVAVNHLIDNGGGQVVVDEGEVLDFLHLPLGGIMADLWPEDMAAAETGLDQAARRLGCKLPSPFGFLMFLSITAIPDYAITDLGLVDTIRQSVVDPILEPVT